ncbi:golgin subfamily A member 6-like protein 25 [Palaemon carinicauda]|uniref:golgin subfamily A member 6-like protein 25 n=1 Tax=Palaemon carinicauda TaxID=392227 RepID=UPI0035B5E416
MAINADYKLFVDFLKEIVDKISYMLYKDCLEDNEILATETGPHSTSFSECHPNFHDKLQGQSDGLWQRIDDEEVTRMNEKLDQFTALAASIINRKKTGYLDGLSGDIQRHEKKSELLEGLKPCTPSSSQNRRRKEIYNIWSSWMVSGESKKRKEFCGISPLRDRKVRKERRNPYSYQMLLDAINASRRCKNRCHEKNRIIAEQRSIIAEMKRKFKELEERCRNWPYSLLRIYKVKLDDHDREIIEFLELIQDQAQKGIREIDLEEKDGIIKELYDRLEEKDRIIEELYDRLKEKGQYNDNDDHQRELQKLQSYIERLKLDNNAIVSQRNRLKQDLKICKKNKRSMEEKKQKEIDRLKKQKEEQKGIIEEKKRIIKELKTRKKRNEAYIEKDKQSEIQNLNIRIIELEKIIKKKDYQIRRQKKKLEANEIEESLHNRTRELEEELDALNKELMNCNDAYDVIYGHLITLLDAALNNDQLDINQLRDIIYAHEFEEYYADWINENYFPLRDWSPQFPLPDISQVDEEGFWNGDGDDLIQDSDLPGWLPGGDPYWSAQ